MPSAPRRAGADLTRSTQCTPVLSRFSLLALLAFALVARTVSAAPLDGGPAPPTTASPEAGDAGATSDAGARDDAPAPVEVRVQGHSAPASAASDTSVGGRELSLRPRLRAEDVVEAVPGLFTVQHSGGGKAQQYFLRGFDADHGTDIAFFVDGIPLNAVSHAHGQGYTDLHFVIPEVIASVDGAKGPYSARTGDFATAGSVNLRLADNLDESHAQVEMGPEGRRRAVIVESPYLGERWRAVVAAEAFTDDGPFLHPEDHRRLNAYARATRRIDDASDLSFMLMGYGATWNASGVLPARAVCGEGDGNPRPAAYSGAGCLSRWDSIDPSQGGASQRFMASAAYRRRGEQSDLEATVFAVRSNLQLFLDDTLFANEQTDGFTYGGGTEQDDARTEVGGSLRVTERSTLAGIPLRTTFGLQLRYDAIANSLHRQEDRVRLETLTPQPSGIMGPIVDSAISETELGTYMEEDLRPTSWLRFVLGGRADRVDVAVDNVSDTALDKTSGSRGGGLFSPKAAITVSPLAELDLFANYGRGFHSNDARGVVGGGDTLLAVATGYEIGATLRPVRGLSLSAVGFLLDITSELVFNGDTGSTVASGATRRYGAEIVGRYHFRRDIYADAELTITQARYVDDVDGQGTYLPLAPVRTFAAGIGVAEPVGPFLLSAAARVKSMADRPASTDGRLTATGFTLVDVQAAVRWRNLELALEVLNLTDAVWREGQFEVTSRLPNEAKPVDGVSFTPGWPREILGHATLYW